MPTTSRCAPTCSRSPATWTASTRGSRRARSAAQALHAGDLQVAASLRLLVTVGDVARAVDERPGRHARAPRLPALSRRRAGRDAPGGLAAAHALLAALARAHGHRHRADARQALPVAHRRVERHADPPAAPHGARARPASSRRRTERARPARTSTRRRAERPGGVPAAQRAGERHDARAAPDGRVGAGRRGRATRPRRSSRARPLRTRTPANGLRRRAGRGAVRPAPRRSAPTLSKYASL